MHILHLEDNAADAELIHHLLYSRWPDCTITPLASRETFEAAVRTGEFDLILSDYSLPQYSGLDALKFVRAHRPDKPFIYISGTIGEERAIEALKAGATDYVIKDRPARLLPAIGAALAHTEQTGAHRRAEEKIREQASLLDKSREAICVADADGYVTYWNASAERLYGWSAQEAVGRNLRDLLYTEDHARFETAYIFALASGEWRGELHPQSRGGAAIFVESRWSLVTDHAGAARTILIIDADVTEKRRIENQLLQSQRLETLGLLVGGIAHDLNNMLAPMLTSVDLLCDSLTCPKDRDLLDLLDMSVRHGTELVRQLLAFARGQGEQRVELASDALIGSVQKLLFHAMPSNIEIRVSLEDELWAVHADATQLRQVLLNLCLNARDAMPEGGLTTTSIQGTVKFGPHVCISVTDTGTGIPPEIIGKIFDPFFTTKQIGKGTGLGLANVVAIVKSHRGFLGLESKPGIGTTFHIYLPALVDETADRSVVLTPRPAVQGRGENILLIDDDEGIRTVMDLLLSTHGYRVTVAADGDEGMELLRKQPDAFALVMTDLEMPGTSGADVIREIRALPAPPKLLVVSGAPDDLGAAAISLGDVEFLNKPMTSESLLTTLRRILGHAPCQVAS
jgi:two-component system, cell cycle sensor histidine kinase and response regulator CckA